MSAQYSTFRYLTAENAELYRAVMKQFVAAKDRFTVHLRPEEIVGELQADEGEVIAALRQLRDWGNLSADPDTTRVTTVEDFHRARFVYQLTDAGESTERAIRQFDDTIGRGGALQSAALVDIRNDLRALLERARDTEADAAKVHPLLLSLANRFGGLADNAQAFVGSLQRTIDLSRAETEVFLEYKDRLIQYLERFVRDLIATGADIAGLIGEIEDHGIDRLLRLAAERELDDEAPLAGGLPGTEGGTVSIDDALAVWRARWRGFRDWFLSTSAHESQSRLLRNRARTAVSQLLQVVTAMNERRSGRTDRAADFRQLAVWFAEAPDDADLHRLARVAFGLAPSRHLTVDAATLDQRSVTPVPANTSWADAPPLQISPRLRATGSYERTGRPNQVRDRSAARRLLAEAAEAQHRSLELIRRQLVTERPQLLGDFTPLDAPAFEHLLKLIGDALGSRRAGGPLTARSLDGTLEIRLTPDAALDGELTELLTVHGVLRGPRHVIEIVPVEGRA